MNRVYRTLEKRNKNNKERRGNKMRKIISCLFILLVLVGCTSVKGEQSFDVQNIEEETAEVETVSLRVAVPSSMSLEEFRDKYLYISKEDTNLEGTDASVLSAETKGTIAKSKTGSVKSASKLSNNTGSTSNTVQLDTSDWRIKLAYEWQGTKFGTCIEIAYQFAQAIGTSDNAFDYLSFGKVSSPYLGCIVTYPGHYATYLKDNMCLHGGWNGSNVKVASCTLGSDQPITGYYDPAKAKKYVDSHSYNDLTKSWEATTDENGEHNHTYSLASEVSNCNTHVVTWVCNTCGATYSENKEIKDDCSLHGDSYMNYNGSENWKHEHNYIQISSSPACVQDGYIRYTCSVCGDAKTETIPATRSEHDYVLVSSYLDSYVCEVINVYKCSICGQSHDEYTGVREHNLVNGRCTRCQYEDPSDPSYVRPGEETPTENTQETNTESEVSTDTEVSE